MNEDLLASGTIGAIVWLATDKRIVIRHESAVPSPAPSVERMQELEDLDWRRWEIAWMYGTTITTLNTARKSKGGVFRPPRNNKR